MQQKVYDILIIILKSLYKFINFIFLNLNFIEQQESSVYINNFLPYFNNYNNLILFY
jgi:hypothetical protein